MAANTQQKLAIKTINGPVLIIAGPGTGKTYTLVERVTYLIKKCKVEPKRLFIATFTEKAAKELVTRISNRLVGERINVNLQDMYVGTFHSLCLRILKDNIELTDLHKNFKVLDSFDQQYFIYQNYWKSFKHIPHITKLINPDDNIWKQSGTICNLVNSLCEELIDSNSLLSDADPDIQTLGLVTKKYEELLDTHNYLDFSHIQTKAFYLLKNNKTLVKKLRAQLTYFMVDEYQDTNYVQEQLIFLLAGKSKNICVVGDDDQGLYRFRGATIENILRFPQKCGKSKECNIIKLETNYRSNSGIVDFYNTWMKETKGFKWGDKYRHQKVIRAHKKTKLNTPSVIKIHTRNIDEWNESVLSFIRKLKRTGKLENLNQIAFLFSSVRNDSVKKLANFLEKNGIKVYAPRSAMFFQRSEIKFAIGCFCLMFPNYVENLDMVLKKGKVIEGPRSFKYLGNTSQYYRSCIEETNKFLIQAENEELRKWLRTKARAHISLIKNTDYAYTDLLYELFQFNPFRKILNTTLGSSQSDVRPLRNLASLSQLIGKYESIYNIDILQPNNIDKNTEQLFNVYLRLLIDEGLSEYEDDTEYAPSGCVSFLTIHQSKGMEFPIVVVNLDKGPKENNINSLISKIVLTYRKKIPYEPSNQTKYFDYWRKFYTAFSRAQDLLVLSHHYTIRPNSYIRDLYEPLKNYDSSDVDLSCFDFQNVKDVELKKTFSFTSHIAVYENCPRQYKFFKELNFLPVRSGSMLFGTLVHETIEDIHKAVLKEELSSINEDNIKKWFQVNYDNLTKVEHYYLAPVQKDAALKQVMRYAERQKNHWDEIKEAEVDVSLVKPRYIVEGKIDLIKGKNDTVEIVDFKSSKKPRDINSSEEIERYRRQLHVYAYLVEQRTKHKVSKMNLYYTGEEDSVPIISFPYTKTAIKGTMASFDDAVSHILNKDFKKSAKNKKLCENCDFRHFCKKNRG